jgi:DNA-binding beta-propeller fold protein YncE
MASFRGLVLSRGAVIVLVGAVGLAVVGLVVARSLVDRLGSNSPCAVVTKPSSSKNRSPAQITAGSRVTAHFEYVVADCEIDVYDVDRGNRFVQRIRLPQIVHPRGVVASPVTGMLYVAYGGVGGDSGNGSMLAYDLRGARVAWQRDYDVGTGSIAITSNGRTIYMPVGEGSHSGRWEIIDAATGAESGSIDAGAGAHNTIISLDGRYLYLAGVDYPYLAVASTATNRVIREIGPLKSGGRPFTINGAQKIAYTTSRGLLGFQISSIRTGKVLFTVRVPGFSYDPHTFRRSPCHGISLAPNERQLYLIDTPNGYVHVFDVSRIPALAPRHLADIKLDHPPPHDGWLQHSRDGRYVYVGRAGDVIDTRTFKVVGFLPPLQNTADSLEIDWQEGRPVSTTSRYGLGYVRP